jgi:Cytidylyltransferase-like
MSGVAGAERVKSRQDFRQFLSSYQKLVSKFPGFVSLRPSGSYNSNLKKNDFGDIDLIVHIKSDQDKPTVKKQLQAFFHQQPETVIVPFSSEKHAGKRSYNAGELVSVRYHDDQLGYSAQIDNIVALDETEAGFKQSFLDFPAEKQGLILGLVKVASIETDPAELFKRLGIPAQPPLAPNQEYEFNLSSVELQLRVNTYKTGTYELENKQVIWASKTFGDLEKLLYQYDLSDNYTGLLAQAKKNIHNPRSAQRIVGVFGSMVTVKSGEIGTAKAAGKEQALAKIRQTFGESAARSVVMAFGRFQPPTVGHQQLINVAKNLAKRTKSDYVIYVSKTQGTTAATKLRNPLSIEQKMHFLRSMFPDTNFVACDDRVRTPIEAAAELNRHYQNLIMVAGSDRKASFRQLLQQQNGADYNYQSIKVVSAGKRDPDSDSIEGVRGTDLRQYAQQGDIEKFKQYLPSTADEKTAQELMLAVQQGMEHKKPNKASTVPIGEMWESKMGELISLLENR